MKFVDNVPWLSNISIMEGKKNEAWISYNSSSKNLSVVFTGFKNNDIDGIVNAFILLVSYAQSQ